MPRSGFQARWRTTLISALVVGLSTGVALTQETPRPQTSVRGTLVVVNHVSNTVIMKSDKGENLSWRFEADVIKEVEKFEEGTRVIVIYRDLPSGVKRVTALAFPGIEQAPTYVNMTGGRITLRSAPFLDGECDGYLNRAPEDAGSHIPQGGRAEVLEDCWCCSVSGESCYTTTKSGVGRAYLVQCF